MVLVECIQIPVSQGQFIVDKKVYPDIKIQNGDSCVSSFFCLQILLDLLNNDRWAF